MPHIILKYFSHIYLAVNPNDIPLWFFCLIRGLKSTLLIFIPAFTPSASSPRNSPNWAMTEVEKVRATANSNKNLYFFILFKIKFNQFIIFGKAYEKHFPIDKTAPIVHSFKLETSLNGIDHCPIHIFFHVTSISRKCL